MEHFAVRDSDSFLAELDRGSMTASYLETVDQDCLIDSLRGVFLKATLPFMVATRFKYRRVQDVLASSDRIAIRNITKSPAELMKLFFFDVISRSPELEFGFGATVTDDCFRSDIDEKMMGLYDKAQAGNYRWWWDTDGGTDVFSHMAALTSRYDRKHKGGVSTPLPLISSILDEITPRLNTVPKIADLCCGRGSFLYVAANQLIAKGFERRAVLSNLYAYDIDQRKAFITAALLDPDDTGLVNVYSIDSMAEEIDMKFDVIIGNPPYKVPGKEATKGTRANALWSKFIQRANQLAKPGGYIGFVTPPNWLNTPKGFFTDNQTLWVKTDIGAKDFPGVGSAFTAWVVQKVPYTKPTYFVDHAKHIDIRAKHGVPLRSIEGHTIKDKVVRFRDNYPGKLIRFQSDKHHHCGWKNQADKNHLYSPEPGAGRPYKIHHTNKGVCWGHYRPDDYDAPKVVITLSGYPNPQYVATPIGTCAGISGHILVKNESEGNNLVKLINSKLYTFYRDCGRSGGMNIFSNFALPMLDLTKAWSDAELYDLVGLTDEEIAIVEQFEGFAAKGIKGDEAKADE